MFLKLIYFKINMFLKRMIDILGSFLGILILLPLFILISIAIKIDSEGEVIFKQKRLKKNGEIFYIYKFRSMIKDAEKKGTGLFNFKNDFRVTKVGNFLRKTSLDELPQLFNVILGDMSLVGPRPPVNYELGDYNNLSEKYKNRFKVKPGITGLAQISGRNELEWEEKVKYDNLYIEKLKKYGVLLDIQIIIKTIINIFLKKDIYEEDSHLENLSDEEKLKKSMEKVLKSAKGEKNE